MLNLHLKIKLPNKIEGITGLLPSLILEKLTIENFKHLTRQTQNEVIKLDLLNRSFKRHNQNPEESRNSRVNIITQE